MKYQQKLLQAQQHWTALQSRWFKKLKRFYGFYGTCSSRKAQRTRKFTNQVFNEVINGKVIQIYTVHAGISSGGISRKELSVKIQEQWHQQGVK